MTATDFPIDMPASPADDPGNGWRVMDASGNTADYDGRQVARHTAADMRGSCAVYVRKNSGEWWLYETLLRED